MSQPAGWYDDPQDPSLLRYWDGVLWTAHTTPKASPTASSSSIGRAPDVPAYGSTPPGPSAQSAPASPGSSGGAVQGYDRPPTSYGYGAEPQAAWTGYGPTAPDGAPLAEWWQRLLARLVDNLILGMLLFVLGFRWVSDVTTAMGNFFQEALRQAEAGATTLDSMALTEQIAGPVVRLTLLTVAISVVYETFFLLRSGATPGKKVLGITVRRVQRPGPLQLGEALRRQLLPQGCQLLGLVPVLSLVTWIPQILDPLWLLWDPRRQALHDKMADTLVVKVPRLR